MLSANFLSMPHHHSHITTATSPQPHHHSHTTIATPPQPHHHSHITTATPPQPHTHNSTTIETNLNAWSLPSSAGQNTFSAQAFRVCSSQLPSKSSFCSLLCPPLFAHSSFLLCCFFSLCTCCRTCVLPCVQLRICTSMYV